MTHAQLVRFAAKWLRNVRRCGVVLCEVGRGGETPDAIGWQRDGRMSILVECKISRADFLADRNKSFRQPTGSGSAMGDERYYLAPAGLIKLDELPPNWGLLELTGRGVSLRRAAHRYQYAVGRKQQEMGLLWSELRLYQLAASGRELFPSKRAIGIEAGLKAAAGGEA